VIYKRRVSLCLQDLSKPLEGVLAEKDTQVSRELRFYLQSTNVIEKMFISFRRKAFVGKEDANLRITLDSDIRYRLNQLNFSDPDKGKSVLDENYQIMEIKTLTSIPLWLARLCSHNGIFAVSYSKYAACYTGYFSEQEQKGSDFLCSKPS